MGQLEVKVAVVTGSGRGICRQIALRLARDGARIVVNDLDEGPAAETIELVRKLFGDDVAARVGPIWGFGAEQELRNMYARTAQPGLWFIAGSFAQCRIYSKYLGLQIKACEIGLLPGLGANASERAA